MPRSASDIKAQIRSVRLLLLLLPLLWAAPLAAHKGHHQEVVDLQLRWHHQFQFAGYYAALEKGFYRDEGLEVRLHPGSAERQPVGEVLAGRAQYAEGNSEVLLQRLRGEPLVALAVIFQHSPSVLLARRDAAIVSAHDLIGKRIMLMDGMNDADFLTMLLNEGIATSQVEIIPSSYDIEDLINGRADAFNSYLTNEPYELEQRGIDYTVIDPRNYRVDFYSDILFTSEQELRDHPERVEAIRRATLRGWHYALDHPEEIIDLLIDRYRVTKSREHLQFEAETMRRLILPDLIEIGHMNPRRWQHMADTFVSAGLIGADYSLDGFVYEPRSDRLPAWVVPVLLGALAVIVLISLAAVRYLRVNRHLALTEAQLRSANDLLATHLAEIEELHQRLQEQAIRDPTTGLYNRRYLEEVLIRELARAKRDGYPISLAMIDVDHFKHVNDTYGHQAGDRVLQALGKLLRTQAREGDIPCRYGGEEFVLVLPRLPAEVARKRVEQWRRSFSVMATRHGELEIRATLSIGLATFPDHAANAEGLIACADRALYRAKAGGRDRVEVVA